jgi:NADH:ubiquinone oxidoreductase subunit E
MIEPPRRSRLMVGEAPSPAQGATPAEQTLVDEVLVGFQPFNRTQLLPLLQAVQARSSSLSKGMLGYLGAQTRVPFAELYGVASFYALLDTGRPPVAIRVCNGVPCILAGAEALGSRLLAQTGLAAGQAGPDGPIAWEWFPCIGQCDRAPAALIGEEAVYGPHLDRLIQPANGVTHADD